MDLPDDQPQGDDQQRPVVADDQQPRRLVRPLRIQPLVRRGVDGVLRRVQPRRAAVADDPPRRRGIVDDPVLAAVGEAQPQRRQAVADDQPRRRGIVDDPVLAAVGEAQPQRRPAVVDDQPPRRPAVANAQPQRRPAVADDQPQRRPVVGDVQPQRRPGLGDIINRIRQAVDNDQPQRPRHLGMRVRPRPPGEIPVMQADANGNLRFGFGGVFVRRSDGAIGRIRARPADSPRAPQIDHSEPFKTESFNKRLKVSAAEDPKEAQNRYRKAKLFTDVSVKIGDKLYDAHRGNLASRSPFFEALVSDNWLENKVCELNSDSVDPEIAEPLLEYIYTDKIELTSENARKFCIAAHYLQMTELLSRCEMILIQSVSSENAMDEFKFGHFFGLVALMTRCITEIPKLQQESRGSMLHGFEKGEILRLLDCVNDKLNPAYNGLTALKEFIVQCALTWAKEKPEGRKEQLSEILEKIPLKDLSLPFFRDVVSEDSLIRQSAECLNSVTKELWKKIDIPQLNSTI